MNEYIRLRRNFTISCPNFTPYTSTYRLPSSGSGVSLYSCTLRMQKDSLSSPSSTHRGFMPFAIIPFYHATSTFKLVSPDYLLQRSTAFACKICSSLPPKHPEPDCHYALQLLPNLKSLNGRYIYIHSSELIALWMPLPCYL